MPSDRGEYIVWTLAARRLRNKVKPDPQFLATRTARLEQRAIANGVAPVRSNPKKGEPEIIGFGEAIKREIPLFQTYHDGKELLYRVLSSHIHARPWAWMDATKAMATAEPGVSLRKAELDINLYVSILVLTIKTHERALIRLLELSGGTKVEWETKKQEHIARVRPRYLAMLAPG